MRLSTRNADRGSSCSRPATRPTALAETCVSLIPGIAELVADKGYDNDAFRVLLKEKRIKTGQATPTTVMRSRQVCHQIASGAIVLWYRYATEW
jgi:hypothetical protein